MDDGIRFELEKIRHDYDLRFAELQNRHQLDMQMVQSRLDSLERETARVRDWSKKQDNQLEQLLAMGQKIEKDANRAITPNNIRNWIIGLASLIGAIMLILSTLDTYNQNQVIKHEEKRWIQEQREQPIKQ